MVAKKKGLGKGLDSLIPASKPKESEKVEVKVKEAAKSGEQMMNINDVEPSRDQPRKKFEEDPLLELADSIKQYGVLQPIIVRKKDNYYEIIAGERRWRAAKIAGLKEIPVIIKDYSEQWTTLFEKIPFIPHKYLTPFSIVVVKLLYLLKNFLQ